MGKKLWLFLTVLTLATAGIGWCANLLQNGSFEDPHNPAPFIKLDPGIVPTPGVWYSEGAEAISLFDGVFDSSWNVPPDVAGWPSNLGPLEGSYYLGKYRKPGVADGQWMGGAVYQMVPATAGTTYYATAWLSGYDPHGWGAAMIIGIDPTGALKPDTQQPDWESASIVWAPLKYDGTIEWLAAKREWQKLQVQATAAPVDPVNPMITVWLRYMMPPNNNAAPQMIQVDSASLSEQAGQLFIQDMFIQGVSNTWYKAQWRVTDGVADTPATCTLTLNTPGGPVTKSVTYDSATKVYTCNMSGLVANTAYTFTVNATTAGYDPAVYNGSFKSYPVLVISTPVVSEITQTSAKISWDTFDKVSPTTPVASTGTVKYGSYYSLSATDTPGPNPTLKTHHDVVLTGLQPNTAYQFKVLSDRPEGSTNPGPYGTSMGAGSFQTPGGPFYNGDFELTYADPMYRDDPIPGWTKIPDNVGGNLTWYFNNEWGIPSKSGSRYILQPSNYGGPTQSGMYQNFQTTPGEMLIFSAWVRSESYAPGGITDGGSPHRFGETNVRIGIDPNGGTNPDSSNILWSADRETLDWHRYVTEGSYAHEWQKVQIAAQAGGTSATLFLKCNSFWGNNWVMTGFDNITKETGTTPVASVAQAKQLDNDTAISLSGNVVVTYKSDESDLLMSENFQRPYFYIQDEDGTAGIKVVMAKSSDPLPAGLEVGKRVSIDGLITWGAFYNPSMVKYFDQQQRLDKPSGERVIKALPNKVTVGTDGVIPKPVGMSNRDLCGGSSADHWFTNPGVQGGTGPNNVGKLVKIWGKLVFAGMSGEGTHQGRYYVVIDDGSSVPRFGSTPTQPETGVFIDVGSVGMADTTYYELSSHMGEYATVIGISAPALDYDWDDAPAGTFTTPESMKNVRSIKPLSFTAPNFVFMPVQ